MNSAMKNLTIARKWSSGIVEYHLELQHYNAKLTSSSLFLGRYMKRITMTFYTEGLVFIHVLDDISM